MTELSDSARRLHVPETKTRKGDATLVPCGSMVGMRLLCLFFDQLCYSPMLQIMSDYALAVSRLFSEWNSNMLLI